MRKFTEEQASKAAWAYVEAYVKTYGDQDAEVLEALFNSHKAYLLNN